MSLAYFYYKKIRPNRWCLHYINEGKERQRIYEEATVIAREIEDIGLVCEGDIQDILNYLEALKEIDSSFPINEDSFYKKVGAIDVIMHTYSNKVIGVKKYTESVVKNEEVLNLLEKLKHNSDELLDYSTYSID